MHAVPRQRANATFGRAVTKIKREVLEPQTKSRRSKKKIYIQANGTIANGFTLATVTVNLWLNLTRKKEKKKIFVNESHKCNSNFDGEFPK